MADKKKKESLKQRDSIVSRVELFEKYLATLPADGFDVTDLELRKAKIEDLYVTYEDLQVQIELASDDLSEQMLEREKFETIYFRAVSLARSKIELHSDKAKPCVDNKPTSTTVNTKNSCIKLPTIQLPTFDGAYEKWLEFHDTFTTMIVHDQEMANITKFHYLRASLMGSAALVIKSLEFSEKNYHQAWELLCNRYNNKKVLINNHISALFNMEKNQKESSMNIRDLIDAVLKNLRALDSLGQTTSNWDTLIIYIVTTKLDNKTSRLWEEQKIRTKDMPKLEILIDFLRNQADLLETLEGPQQSQLATNKGQQSNKVKALTATQQSKSTGQNKCALCNQSHWLFACKEFLGLSPKERYQKTLALKLCINCLKPNHTYKDCKSGKCRVCAKSHNSLLHFDQPTEESPPLVFSNTVSGRVLLSTALVKIMDKNGEIHSARALLDSGSMTSFISERLCRKLSLKEKRISTAVSGISGKQTLVSKSCVAKITSNAGNFTTQVHFLVIHDICQNIPSTFIDLSGFNIPTDIVLADPTFNEPLEIDILLGAELFWDLLLPEQLKLGPGMPILQHTRLGWTIAGLIHNKRQENVQCYFSDIQEQLAKFWDLDGMMQKSPWSPEENLCEEQFVKSVKRLSDGRFSVKIPLKESQNNLGDSYQRALRCLLSLEKRLQKEPKTKGLYHSFLQEYLDLGHMSASKLNSPETAYYMPHHGVMRESSLTTKLRVVFNCSASTTSGKSFNDIQMVGPTIQSDLITILIRFRQHQVVITADVAKMYRQVEVTPDQRPLQQILWRFNPEETIKAYTMNTVTYGTASAPFLAIRCLHQLGLESTETHIKEVITNDFYVDDLITGVETISEAKDVCSQLSSALALGCFELRKWRSNNPIALSGLQSQKTDTVEHLDLSSEEPSKTLGMLWDHNNVLFLFNITPPEPTRITKRHILSVASQVFDPLGLLSPFILQAKVILQQLWIQNLSWDDEVPEETAVMWRRFVLSLKSINHIQIPRSVIAEGAMCFEIHVFCDASEVAYGACAYLRSIDSHNNKSSSLICAKGKVAPLKTLTIPKLELCGALLGAKLLEKVSLSFRGFNKSHHLWTDSTIVLGWVKTEPVKLKIFERNRVADIQMLTQTAKWHHVPTDMNPADILSRGSSSQDLADSTLWWRGPSFLRLDETEWPVFGNHSTTESSDHYNQSLVVRDNPPLPSIIDVERFSNFNRLRRSIAYVLRFLHNSSPLKTKLRGPLSAEELDNSLVTITKIIQMESFPDEYKILSKGLPITSGRLKHLSPFLHDGVIKVGGRLRHANLPPDKKHPSVIDAKHHFTKILFHHIHTKTMHGGPQLLLFTIREAWWPLGGRNLARNTTHRCVTCIRWKAKIVPPIMGDLPTERVSCDYPFTHTCVDYAGPFNYLDRKGRGAKLNKCYISVFVCCTSKAIHLELVTELTTRGFLLCLQRFIARRGKPTNIICDNATNFVGVQRELAQYFENDSTDLINSYNNEGITFKFIPPQSPHFGGLHEAGVRSVKHHLKRVMGLTNLTYEEFYTLLTQIEQVLNSRPLSPLSTDDNDLLPLTPSHFLIGRSNSTAPISSDSGAALNRSTRYEIISRMRLDFWTRWSKEYISELQTRKKWYMNQPQLKVGDLAVIKEDNLPPLKWRLGRVIAVFPGCDGVARVYDVKTANGVIRRSFSRLCPLEV